VGQTPSAELGQPTQLAFTHHYSTRHDDFMVPGRSAADQQAWITALRPVSSKADSRDATCNTKTAGESSNTNAPASYPLSATPRAPSPNLRLRLIQEQYGQAPSASTTTASTESHIGVGSSAMTLPVALNGGYVTNTYFPLAAPGPYSVGSTNGGESMHPPTLAHPTPPFPSSLLAHPDLRTPAPPLHSPTYNLHPRAAQEQSEAGLSSYASPNISFTPLVPSDTSDAMTMTRYYDPEAWVHLPQPANNHHARIPMQFQSSDPTPTSEIGGLYMPSAISAGNDMKLENDNTYGTLAGGGDPIENQQDPWSHPLPDISASSSSMDLDPDSTDAGDGHRSDDSNNELDEAIDRSTPTPGNGDKRVARRRQFTDEQRAQTGETRKSKACIRCRSQKVRVSNTNANVLLPFSSSMRNEILASAV
jgi:hypothetical protein